MERKRINDGYVGIYRPSLTDSRIKSNSLSLYQQYALIPPTQPKRRDWCDKSGKCNTLHLTSQLWSPEQTKFYQVVNEKESIAKRLGISLSVLQIDKINPVESYWRGIIKLSLFVSDEEKWGQNSNTHDPNAEEKLEKEEIERKIFEELFENTFGIRFYNMIDDDDHSVDILSGPMSWEEMESDKEEKITNTYTDDEKKAEDTDDKKKPKYGVKSGSWVIRASFYNTANLRYYPFDVCAWDVIITYIGCSAGVKYDHSSLASSDEFEVFGLRGDSLASKNKWWPYALEMGVIPNTARFAEGLFYGRFYSRRYYFQTLHNFVFPVALVTLMGEVAFWQAAGRIEDDNIQTDALAFQTTALLTNVAMKFAYSDSLPSLTYSTLLDNYINAIIVIMISAVFIIAHVSKDDLDASGAGFIYIGIVLLLHIIFGILGYKAYYIPIEGKEKIYKMSHAYDEAVEESYMNPGPQAKENVEGEKKPEFKCLNTYSHIGFFVTQPKEESKEPAHIHS